MTFYATILSENCQIMKKKTFVLLELLIAFALLSISVLPFIRFPYTHMQKEIDALFTMKLEQEAQEALAKMQRDLYKKKVPTNLLFGEEKQTKIPYAKEKILLTLPTGMQREYEKQVFYFWDKQKSPSDLIKYALITLRVDFIPKKPRTKKLRAEIQTIVEETHEKKETTLKPS